MPTFIIGRTLEFSKRLVKTKVCFFHMFVCRPVDSLLDPVGLLFLHGALTPTFPFL